MKLKPNILFLILLTTFLTVGYYYSDARFFKKEIENLDLKTPDTIFSFINKRFIHGGKNVHTNATPRHLYTNHKRLYCDEGAALIATFCYYNGYKTQFVRVINTKGIDSHTFLQAQEDGKWNSYDFTFQIKNATKESLQKISGIQIKKFTYYSYPRLYNKIIQYNFFLKKLALFIRGIDEDDTVE